jgi:hypothetical protein
MKDYGMTACGAKRAPTFHRVRRVQDGSARWLTWAKGGPQGGVGVITIGNGAMTIYSTVLS